MRLTRQYCRPDRSTEIEVEMALEIEKAEYESLRKEIAETLTELRAFERYIVTVVGLIITWLATHRNQIDLGSWVWWVPFLVVMLGAVREFALYRSIGI